MVDATSAEYDWLRIQRRIVCVEIVTRTHNLRRRRVLQRSYTPRIDGLALAEEIGELLALGLPKSMDGQCKAILDGRLHTLCLAIEVPYSLWSSCSV